MNQSMPEGIKPAKFPSELTLLLLFVFPSLLTANTCAARTSGNFNVPNTWTRCGATTPQPGDTISIGTTHVVTLTSDATFISGILTGSTGRLVSDGAPHLLTLLGTSGTLLDCLRGPNNPADTTAGFCINLDRVSVSAPNLTAGAVAIGHTYGLGSSVALRIVNAPGLSVSTLGYVIGGDGRAGADNYVITNNQFTGGGGGIIHSRIANLNVSFNAFTGMSGDDIFNISVIPSTTCTISHNSDRNPLAHGYLYKTIASDPCSGTGNSQQSDPAGLYTRYLVRGNNGAMPNITWTFNIGRSYAAGANMFASQPGTAFSPAVFSQNVSVGYDTLIRYASYNDSRRNVAHVYSYNQAGQGAYFCYGFITACNSANDIGIVHSGVGNILWFGLTGANFNITNATAINDNTAENSLNFLFGELGDGNQCGIPGAPCSMLNSISYGAANGVYSYNPANHFSTLGTGSAGVAGNNVYGALTPYSWLAPATNFGTSPAHPSATYADQTLNPAFPEIDRTYTRCDEILGWLPAGTGSEDHLFQQLANRSNGTNAPAYTPEAVYACMVAPLFPQNPQLTTAGALPPQPLLGAVQ